MSVPCTAASSSLLLHSNHWDQCNSPEHQVQEVREGIANSQAVAEELSSFTSFLGKATGSPVTRCDADTLAMLARITKEEEEYAKSSSKCTFGLETYKPCLGNEHAPGGARCSTCT